MSLSFGCVLLVVKLSWETIFCSWVVACVGFAAAASSCARLLSSVSFGVCPRSEASNVQILSPIQIGGVPNLFKRTLWVIVFSCTTS
jgi:hypothetical protein